MAVGERAAPKPAGHRPADIASSAICVVTAVVVDAPDPEAALGDSSTVAEVAAAVAAAAAAAVAAAVAAATAAADSLTAAGALMSLCDVSNLSSPRYV